MEGVFTRCGIHSVHLPVEGLQTNGTYVFFRAVSLRCLNRFRVDSSKNHFNVSRFVYFFDCSFVC